MKSRKRAARAALVLAVGTAGFATAVLAAVALAKTFTLGVSSKAKVTNTSGKTVHEGIVVNGKSFAVYTLSGDSKHHPKCTKSNGCFQFWVPVKVSSSKKMSKAPHIKGSLSTWKRNGFNQVLLGGHPLYTFTVDTHKNSASGEGVKTFGGTWHVVKVGKSSSKSTGSSTSSSSMTTTSSYTYPPY